MGSTPASACGQVARRLSELRRDDSGQGLAEYALLIALVSIALVIALVLLGDRLGTAFGKASDGLENAGQGPCATPPGHGGAESGHGGVVPGNCDSSGDGN